MTLAAMRTELLDRLFATGAAWTRPVTEVAGEVAAAMPGGVSVPASDLAAYARFASQVAREFQAVSGDLLEAGGALGAPTGYVREAVGGLLRGRYLAGATDWRLWTDGRLRGELAAGFGAAWRDGRDAAAAAAAMLDILADHGDRAETAVGLPQVSLPSALGLDRLAAPASDIGSFGPVGFAVSAREIFTVREMGRKREAGFAEHPVVNGATRLQFTGIGLWEISLGITLSRAWTDPETRIARLEALQEAGEHHPLVIGGRVLGRFVLASLAESTTVFARGGGIETATLDLNLREYADDGSGVVRVTRVRAATAAPVRQMSVSNYGGR
ncbi:phage tail protein [Pseudodesulfovibrio pelocollis]|uniref:phage tail protein n=1 Tax=Pseudodesulfovibrio pelocollis TaxID=3051432 RepID=UPI00255B1E49|nr:phage tail protein [Pseudodesulfovibrio sp. SB368]